MGLDKTLVVVEANGSRVLPASLELLTQARTLAAAVEAVTWGDAAELAAEVGEYGASRIFHVGDVDGGLPGPATAASIAAIVESGASPDAILVPQTYDGRDVAARLSVRLDKPVITNVIGMEGEGDGLRSVHGVFGGTKVVKAAFTGGKPWIFVVKAKSFAAEPSGGAPAEVVTAAHPDLGLTAAAKIIDRHVEESTGPKLDEADVVVAGGRGLGSKEAYGMVEELARLLGGAPGASRAIVDADWVPYSYQVGQTGKTVKPTVYVALGISGATQHLVGMKGAKNIIAVNKDKEAPIFSVADLGIVGDVHQVLPKLIEALKARR